MGSSIRRKEKLTRNLTRTALLVTCGLSFLSFSLSVPAATFTVQMDNYFYNPTNSNISTGDTVLWTNTSATFHDSRSTNSVWASPQVPANGTYAFTFTNAGYYPYFCFTHRAQNPHAGTVNVVTATTNLPSITAQPTSQTVSSGGIASFGLTAGGPEPLSYQWRNSGGSIPDATNAAFSLNPALTNHEGNYFAVVSNPYGQLTSAVASLTVFIPASITAGLSARLSPPLVTRLFKSAPPVIRR